MPAFFAGDEQPPITQGSGRRELARWVASKDNPLTARVIVNRVWQWHFGDGAGPHAEQLRHAVRAAVAPGAARLAGGAFVEDGWSLKKLHRRIMLSATYQQSSVVAATELARDPENRWLGRFTAAAAGGRGDPRRHAVRRGPARPDAGRPGRRTTSNTPRRSLYVQTARWDRSNFATLFDAANPDASAEKRDRLHRRAAGAVPAQPSVRLDAGQAPGRTARRDVPRRRRRPHRARLPAPVRQAGPAGRDRGLPASSSPRRAGSGRGRLAATSPTSCCAATSSCTWTEPSRPARIMPMWEPNRPLPPRSPGTSRQRLRPAGARATCWRASRAGAAAEPDRAANPYAVRAPHHRAAREARASSSTCPAGRRTSTCSTPSRGWPRRTASRCRSRSRSSSAPRRATCSPRPWKFAKHGQCGIEVSELLPHLARARRRPLRDPLDGRRQHQPHRRGAPDEHRRAGLLAAEPGLVARLRPGHGEPEPARLRRRQPRRGLPGGPALELELPAQRLSGDARPRPRPARSPTSPTPPAILRRSAPSSTRSAGSTSSTSATA